MKHYNEYGRQNGKSETDMFGDRIHYDAHGFKTGKSKTDLWGDKKHYDAYGMPIGKTKEGMFGDEIHYDSNGFKIGETRTDAWGNKIHYDAHGFKIGETRNDDISDYKFGDIDNSISELGAGVTSLVLMLLAYGIKGIWWLLKNIFIKKKAILFYISMAIGMATCELLFERELYQNSSDENMYEMLWTWLGITIVAFIILLIMQYKLKIKNVVAFGIFITMLTVFAVLNKEILEMKEEAASWDLSSYYYSFLYEARMKDIRVMEVWGRIAVLAGIVVSGGIFVKGIFKESKKK